MSGAAPGEVLLGEIREQPAAAARLLRSGAPVLERIADEVRARGVRLVVVVARGTSDHAAIYAQYLLGLRNRLAVSLAAPSLSSLYGVTPDYRDALVVAISQSGASPDVRSVVEAARAAGALTLALTNDPVSPLAAAAERVVPLDAGVEHSIAATKTYTAELVAVALLSAALDAGPADRAALAALPGELAAALESDGEAARIAADQAGIDEAVVLGRGLSYPTAREWAIKLKEIAALRADPYSAADFEHGPLTLLRPGSAVLAAVGRGPARDPLVASLRRLRDERGARLLVCSDDPAARAEATWALPVPAGHPEWLDPIVAIVPAQLHSVRLALARGVDPDRPAGLTKVTRTR